MRQQDKFDSNRTRPSAGRARPAPDASAAGNVHLVQVYPVPRSRTDILSVAIHLVGRFAAAQGKPAPTLSEDAATFLAGRRWRIDDLARRMARAVAANTGSLITAADLCDL